METFVGLDVSLGKPAFASSTRTGREFSRERWRLSRHLCPFDTQASAWRGAGWP